MAPLRANCVYRPDGDALCYLAIRGWESPAGARRLGRAMSELELEDGGVWVDLARALPCSDVARVQRLGDQLITSRQQSWSATATTSELELRGVVNSRGDESLLNISPAARPGMTLFARMTLTIRYDPRRRECVLYLLFRDERQARAAGSFYVPHVLDSLGVPLGDLDARVMIAYQRLVGKPLVDWYGDVHVTPWPVRCRSLTLAEHEDPYLLGSA